MQDRDINLLIKPRNARLLRLMRAMGWETVGAMCAANNLPPQTVGSLVNMTESPLSKISGEWRVPAKKLADVLHVTPDIIWPEHMQKVIASRAKTEVEVSLDEAISISDQSNSAAHLLENKQVVDDLLSVLTPRERAVVTMRMNGGTLAQCGRALGAVGLNAVTGARLRQIEEKAHRKMKRKAVVKFKAEHTRELLHLDGSE